MPESITKRDLVSPQLPKLFIGPWVGEFGIELLHWQGVARAAAKSRIWGEVVVASWPDREFFYSDFADRFVPFTPPTFHTAGANCHGFDTGRHFWEEELDEARGDVWLKAYGDPRDYLETVTHAASSSEFRDFSVGTSRPTNIFDILIHARATTKHNQGHKNWPVQHWENLVDALPTTWRVASIGDRMGSHKVTGTEDLRGISLDSLASHCVAAKMLVGPSSGPVHFAIHCGLPCVIWMGEHRHHYFPRWNPQDVPVICFDTWQPTVDAVLARIRDLSMIEESKRGHLRYLAFATKRSGHHAVIDWLTRLDPSLRHVWLNDCVSDDTRTHPHVSSLIPTKQLLPKRLSEPSPHDLVIQSGPPKAPPERILTLEGVPITDIPQIPEAQEAERILFIIRDSLNFVSSYAKTFPMDLRSGGYLGPVLTETLRTYRQYLQEALGKTCNLGGLRSKCLFISYNRWLTESSYRREISMNLGAELEDADLGIVAPYGPRSAFQPPGTGSGDLHTLERWRDNLNDFNRQAIWTACRTPEITADELAFHGPTVPAARIDDLWRTKKEF